MKRTILASLVLALVTGCTGMQVTDAAKKIKLVEKPPEGCELVDSFAYTSGGRSDAELYIINRTWILNAAAKMGVTHVVILHVGSGRPFATRSMAADGYRCPTTP